MHREGGEKVSGKDMTYLWVLLDPSRFLHLPFALAVALSTRATGAFASSPLGRRYFITRLARSYRILTAPVVASLTALPPVCTTARALEKMGLIEQQRPGQFVRAPTEAVQDPQPAYAQPGRRRRRQPAPTEPTPQPQQEEVTELRRLETRVARMEDQLVWIGEIFAFNVLLSHACYTKREGVVSDKCGVTMPPPLVLTTGVFTVALQLQIVNQGPCLFEFVPVIPSTNEAIYRPKG
ncbi:hypothetical protein L2E82_17447 [Cichorium intybus]|uniref:Uncharacterized protein n=1 Tax=Cichorium intybus TaxID=13427 RepID=A0ACB9F9K9_CICIN|nr:hypothetical protein L2E82_17447 [Cichorium intybus]